MIQSIKDSLKNYGYVFDVSKFEDKNRVINERKMKVLTKIRNWGGPKVLGRLKDLMRTASVVNINLFYMYNILYI